MTTASAVTVPPSTPSSTACTIPNSSNANAATPTPTPPIARHNYANPHTPIASVKRPRSSTTTTNSAITNLSPLHPPRPVPGRAVVVTDEDTTVITKATAPSSPVASPTDGVSETGTDCHSANSNIDPAATTSSTWVGRQVDALFSPVLNFLQHNSSNHRHDDHLPTTPTSSSSEEEDVAAVTDEDVTMEEVSEKVPTPTNHHHTPPNIVDVEEVIAIADQKDVEEHHVADTVAEASSTEASVDVDDEDEFNPYLFIKSLPPYELVAPFRPPVALPPKLPLAPSISLILDLDETLVHCSVEGTCPQSSITCDPPPPPDLIFPVLFHGMTYQVQVRLRPHLFTFLEAISQKFEVVVFTASQKVYADELLNLLDPGTTTNFLYSFDSFNLTSCYRSLYRQQIHSSSSLSRILLASGGEFLEGFECPGT
jgi:hypothetical protein